MDNSYKNIIFTKHSLERMGKRSIDQDRIWQVINHPRKVYNSSGGSKKYLKTINDRRFQVIATYLPKEKKYLVISTWVRGEDDKQGIVWTIITLPFKIIWWLISRIF